MAELTANMEPATTRIESSILKEIDKIAEREKMDRATLLRQLIDAGLKMRRLEHALESYRKGEATLWKAADMAGLSLHEMVLCARREGIPIQYSEEDLERDVERLKKTWSGR